MAGDNDGGKSTKDGKIQGCGTVGTTSIPPPPLHDRTDLPMSFRAFACCDHPTSTWTRTIRTMPLLEAIVRTSRWTGPRRWELRYTRDGSAKGLDAVNMGHEHSDLEMSSVSSVSEVEMARTTSGWRGCSSLGDRDRGIGFGGKNTRFSPVELQTVEMMIFPGPGARYPHTAVPGCDASTATTQSKA